MRAFWALLAFSLSMACSQQHDSFSSKSSAHDLLDATDGIWRQITNVGHPRARVDHSAVEIGAQKLLIWSGNYYDPFWGNLQAEPAVYDLAADSWGDFTPKLLGEYPYVFRSLRNADMDSFNRNSFSNASAPRYINCGDKIGSKIFLINCVDLRNPQTGDELGGQTKLYDPATNSLEFSRLNESWIKFPYIAGGIEFEGLPFGSRWVAIGDKLMVWHSRVGGSYFSQTDIYAYGKIISRTGAPSKRTGESVVSLGNKMIVWGGRYENPNHSFNYFNDGAIYDLISDRWTPMSSAGAPTARAYHAAVIVGNKLVIWGGEVDPWGGNSEAGTESAGGAIYDIATDTWTPLTTQNAPKGRSHHSATAIGDQVVIWGGVNSGHYLSDGAILDLSSRSRR